MMISDVTAAMINASSIIDPVVVFIPVSSRI
jgi:hypothetical protein